jgi:DNA polymerase V
VRLPLPVAALAKRMADRTLRAGDINAFLDTIPKREAAVPLMASPAACGFPSPADDFRYSIAVVPDASRKKHCN